MIGCIAGVPKVTNHISEQSATNGIVIFTISMGKPVTAASINSDVPRGTKDDLLRFFKESMFSELKSLLAANAERS